MTARGGSSVLYQAGLFAEAPACDPTFAGLRRTDLGAGAWIDHLAEWIRGHEAVLEALWTTTRWQAQRRRMYDRVVDVPRLVATWPDDGVGHPLLAEMRDALAARYGRPLPRVALAAYRSGQDSVAFQGDRLGPARGDAIVAIVALGTRRRFLLRPAGGGRSRALDLGAGDLLVMGGTCQQTWEHALPKVAHAGLRISVQLRSAPVVAARY